MMTIKEFATLPAMPPFWMELSSQMRITGTAMPCALSVQPTPSKIGFPLEIP